MANLSVKEIRERGRAIILAHPEGIRFSEIRNEILAQHPDINLNTINTQVASLASAYPQDIEKPSKGLYRPRVPGNNVVAPPPPPSTKKCEEEFYQPFADYLKNDLDEATKAVPVGGSAFKVKWGTPDVVGIFRPQIGAILPFEPEIVTAEVKVNPEQPVTAFGQAAAYRLFSHKVYLVLPETMTEEDQSRVEALCLLFGIGLVLFDPEDVAALFTIRVRAQRHSPDPFYMNEFAGKLRTADPAAFDQLFG